MSVEEFLKLKEEIISRLRKELSENLHYHSLEHTLRVIEKAALIAKHEHIDEKDFRLLQIAALFHDIGFVKSSQNHEEIGCGIAKSYLANYELKKEEIDKICGMIKATKIPQQPTNLLEEVLADADLEYLGTDDYEEIAHQLYKEIKFKNQKLSTAEWNKIQLDFLMHHCFFTAYAKTHFTTKKQLTIQRLKTSLGQL